MDFEHNLKDRMVAGDILHRTPVVWRANTTVELQRLFVEWLTDQANAHSRNAHMAKRKRVIHEEIIKSKAYSFAADYVGKIKIEPHK